ncbi:MAG: B12-binding domain-containing radical SAM protein [Promethearchaeota archaeon]
MKPEPLDPGRAYPLSTSLLLLASHLKRALKYVDVEVVDLHFERGSTRREWVESKIAGASLLGITCALSRDYKNTLELAGICRRLNPNAPTVVGGMHANVLPGDFLAHPSLFDYVVVGWGETALEEIVRNSERIGFRRPPTQRLVEGSPSPAVQCVVPEDWKFVERYFSATDVAPKLVIKFSRGCTQSCRFCANSGPFRYDYSALPPREAFHRLVSALKFLSRAKLPKESYLDYGGNVLEVADDIFGHQPAWTRKFLELLVEGRERLPVDDVELIVEQRVDFFSREMVKLFDRARVHVQFGVESLSPEVLQNMGKAANPATYLERVKRVFTGESNEHPHTFYVAMLIFGCPSETGATIDATRDGLWRLGKGLNGPLFVGGQPFALFPGSQVFSSMDAYRHAFGSQFHSPEWWREVGKPSNIIPKSVNNDPSGTFSYFQLFRWMRSEYPAIFSEFNERYSNHRVQEFLTTVWDERSFRKWCNVMMLLGKSFRAENRPGNGQNRGEPAVNDDETGFQLLES